MSTAAYTPNSSKNTLLARPKEEKKSLHCKEFYCATEIAVFETTFRTVASTPDSQACKTSILNCLAVFFLTASTIISVEICND